MNEDPTQVPVDPATPAPEFAPVASLETVSADQSEPATAPRDPVNDPEAVTTPAPVEFTWQASEYVQHHKNISWYGAVVAAVIILCGAAYLLKSWLSIILFIIMGIAVIVYAQRPPRTLTYDLSADGLTIDGKLYPYSTFRSFSVLRDVAWHSIDLEPTQRFMPRMSVLFSDNDFDSIVNHMLDHLPRVDRDLDMVERVTRFLRF